MPHQSTNVIITISAAHKVWSITSHLLSSSGALLTFKPCSICVRVSCSQRERGQEDICFMSAGSVALGSGVISRPLSACGRNMDLSFLKETLRTSVPTAWEGAAEREERKDWKEEDGEKDEQGRGCRKWQCVWSDKPLARTPTPWGWTGGYKTSASVLSATTVPDDPAQPAHCQVQRQ